MTSSTMLALGSLAPDFSLPDVVSQEQVSKKQFEGAPLLVLFICAHCPFVVHVEKGIAAVCSDYKDKLGIVAISANDAASYLGDSPAGLKSQAVRLGFEFPYLYDETQEVAKSYTAACTPDLFLFDAQHQLIYRGELDRSRPCNNEPVDGADLRAALDALLSGEAVSEDQVPSVGCNIKWKAGNEPDYFG